MIVVILFVWLQLFAGLEPKFADSRSDFPATSIMVLIVLLLASFATLMVTIDEKHLKIKFGFGMFRKKFLLQNIQSVRSVRNHWYYGWGIKWWWCPKMWIYSVSGLDAVEITLSNGKVYRIGTDEPKELERALLMSLPSDH